MPYCLPHISLGWPWMAMCRIWLPHTITAPSYIEQTTQSNLALCQVGWVSLNVCQHVHEVPDAEGGVGPSHLGSFLYPKKEFGFAALILALPPQWLDLAMHSGVPIFARMDL